jgi:hypothetical protein
MLHRKIPASFLDRAEEFFCSETWNRLCSSPNLYSTSYWIYYFARMVLQTDSRNIRGMGVWPKRFPDLIYFDWICSLQIKKEVMYGSNALFVQKYRRKKLIRKIRFHTEERNIIYSVFYFFWNYTFCSLVVNQTFERWRWIGDSATDYSVGASLVAL